MRGRFYFSGMLAAIISIGVSLAMGHGGTEIAVKGRVELNGPMRIVGVKFAPGDVVKVKISKPGVAPIVLGESSTSPDGGFDATMHVPGTLRPGLYKLTVEGMKTESLQIAVVSSSGSAAAAQNKGEYVPNEYNRPFAEMIGLAIVIAILAAAGAGLIWLSRSDPRRIS